MPEQQNHLSVSYKDGVCVVEFRDRKILDQLAINEICEQLVALAEEHAPVNMLLNFKNVEHLSSSALGMLISLSKKMSSLRSLLKLSDINPQIYEVFKITKLHKLFDIHDSAESAKASFAHL